MDDHLRDKRQITENSDARQLLAEMATMIRSNRGVHAQDVQYVLKFVLKTIGGKFAVFNLIELKQNSITTLESSGVPDDFRTKGALPGRICYEEFILAGKESAFFPDLSLTRYAAADPDVIRYGLRAYVGVPVHRSGEVIGSLAVYDTQPQIYNDVHADTLQIFAQAVSYIIAHKLSSKSYLRQQLDEHQRLMGQIFQLAPTCIYQIDLRAGRLLKVNEQMCRLTGYSEEELLSMRAEELLTHQSQELFFKTLVDIDAGESPPSALEFEVITKSGAIEWGLLHIHHLVENGKIWGANVVAHVITEQKRISEELAAYRRHLEMLVEERTKELLAANQKLREEVIRRTDTTKELRLKSERLKELNTAMRVLLDKRNEDRLRAEENIRVNLVQLIEPYLDRLDNSGLNRDQQQLLNVIRMNLGEVTGAPMPELSAKYYIFSPTELQVANLIRNGKSTKDMARILSISPRTVESYRNSIRNKLGLKNKKVNLKTYLSAKE
ncbi:MAG: PAS domain S-box protein [Desulfobacteraceae bacterium]|nr:PAS domain S-box protein [Desulfobacteraceae bacterium]